MARAFQLLVAVSLGVWLDEGLRYLNRHTEHAHPRRRHLADVVTITEGRLHR